MPLKDVLTTLPPVVVIFGLTFFGLGEGLLLVSSTGASPWSVLAQGISLNIDYSINEDQDLFNWYCKIRDKLCEDIHKKKEGLI